MSFDQPAAYVEPETDPGYTIDLLQSLKGLEQPGPVF